MSKERLWLVDGPRIYEVDAVPGRNGWFMVYDDTGPFGVKIRINAFHSEAQAVQCRLDYLENLKKAIDGEIPDLKIRLERAI